MTTILSNIRGAGALLLIGLSTLVHGLLIIVLALLKLLTPEGALRQGVRGCLTVIAESWIGFNNLLLGSYRGTQWGVQLPESLNARGCYLVVSNHQSWVDILVLQRCFNRKLPLLRFFLKQSLIWVPVLGACWWALDFPFMKRLSRETLERKPELKGADLEAARRACETFKEVPVAMMSFPEGTRFSPDKQQSSGSPYRYLLKPKAGGVGAVLYALGDKLDGCIDVTIAYPGARGTGIAPSFWDLLSGRIDRIEVHAERLPIPPELTGRNFQVDPGGREELQRWVTALWTTKDERLDEVFRTRQ